MKTNIYIDGTASVSRLLNFEELLDDTHTPIYKELIPVMKLRRMSRIMRMSNYAALQALKQAKIEIPEAINVATGYGCMADTEKFLSTLLETDEEFSNPSAFINSTHNTLAGNLAILIGAKGQNYTFVHPENAFEHALIDANIGMEEGSFNNALLGGVDERIEILDSIYSQLSQHKLGEGASFLSLSKNKTEQSFAKIEAIKLSTSEQSAEDFMAEFIQENKLSEEDISLILSGSEKLSNLPQVNFKAISGEYPSSTAFACSWAAHIISQQKLPSFIDLKLDNISKILIHNSFPRGNQSLIIISTI